MAACFRNNDIGIKLKENDWVIDNKKVGGNALAIHKNRVAVHMCFFMGLQPRFHDITETTTAVTGLPKWSITHVLFNNTKRSSTVTFTFF